MQSDPIGLEGGANTYGYVGGSPVLGMDPLGLVTVTGATSDQLAAITSVLLDLRRRIEEATRCCAHGDTLLDRFDDWTIIYSRHDMPRRGDGYEQGTTNGRTNRTVLYQNSGTSLDFLAHEWAHTVPQNVNMRENGISYVLAPWNERPWEIHANSLEDRLLSSKDICDLLSGEVLQPDPLRRSRRRGLLEMLLGR